MPGAIDHRRIARAAGHPVRGHRRQRHLRRPRPAAGRVHRHDRDGRHGDRRSGRRASSSAARSRSTSRWRRPPSPSRSRSAATSRRSSPTRPSARTSTPKLINELPTGRTPFTIAELAPGLTDNGPNAGQVTIARRLRLRQRLPDQRRRRQRQHLRHQQQPVHRGRDRGDAGAHLGHLGRVRPLLGRRRQRRHQARRQHLLGQLPPQPRATRRGPTRRRSRRASARTATRTRYEGTFGGPLIRAKAVVLQRRPLRELDRRAAPSRRPASATTRPSTTSATS